MSIFWKRRRWRWKNARRIYPKSRALSPLSLLLLLLTSTADSPTSSNQISWASSRLTSISRSRKSRIFQPVFDEPRSRETVPLAGLHPLQRATQHHLLHPQPPRPRLLPCPPDRGLLQSPRTCEPSSSHCLLPSRHFLLSSLLLRFRKPTRPARLLDWAPLALDQDQALHLRHRRTSPRHLDQLSSRLVTWSSTLVAFPRETLERTSMIFGWFDLSFAPLPMYNERFTHQHHGKPLPGSLLLNLHTEAF